MRILIEMHGFCRGLLLLSLSLQAAGQSSWSIGSDIFARLIWVSSLKIGDYLYLDGGYYDTETNGVYDDINQLNETLSIDLSRSWNISDVEINSFSKPSEYYGTRAGAFWWDPESRAALAYGGEFYEPVTAYDTFYLWELQPDGAGGGTWSARSTSGSNNWNQMIPGAYASIAQSSTTAYALGGFTAYGSGAFPLIPGLMAYDFQQQSWTNITSASEFYSDGLALHGAAHFVPNVGAEGLLLFIGGLVNIDGSSTPAPSSNITVFNPATGEWYHQQATGTPAPANRLDPCLIGVQEVGTGSYEIYLWGGRGGSLFTTVDDGNDVYILTLPAFHWIKANAKTTTYRAGPSCDAFGNQLISVGGYNPGARHTKDSWRYGIGVFDMTELRWKSGFDHTASAYVRPDLVNRHYESNPAYPSWNSDAVQVAFAALDGSAAAADPSQDASSTTNAATSTATNTGPSNTSTGSSDSGSPTNVGAIAGGVVGGVVALIGLIVAWFILTRRRQRRVQEAEGAQFTTPELSEKPRTMTATTEGKADLDTTVKGVHNGPWEMGGQYDRPEVASGVQYHAHELDATDVDANTHR